MISEQSTAVLRSLSRQLPDRPPLSIPPRYPWQTRIVIPSLIVLSLALLVGWSLKETLLPITDVRIIPVVLRYSDETLQSSPHTLSQTPGGKAQASIQAAGWIEPDPYAIAVAALTDGTVRDILALEGQLVRKGDVVARLIDDDAKLAVAHAEAEVALRRAEAESAQRYWDHPIDRDREIAVTAALLDETHAEITRLTFEIAAEVAREKELIDQNRRLEPLAVAQAASDQELQANRFRLEAQQAMLAAMKARQPILEAQLRQRTADVEAAVGRGELRIEDKRLLDVAIASQQMAEAQLAEARLRLQRTEVRSPADGVVMSLLVEPGSKLMLAADSPASTYVVRLYDPTKLQVRVDVPLADAEKVEIGAPVEVLVESVPGRALRGEVTRVIHQADVAKNTLQFKVRLLETVSALKPEMLARVRFLNRPGSAAGADISSQNHGGGGLHLPFIPEFLVRRDEATTSVATVDLASGLSHVRKITLGQARYDGWVSVLDGLSAGDVLIADPLNVADEQRVRVVGESDQPFGKGGQ